MRRLQLTNRTRPVVVWPVRAHDERRSSGYAADRSHLSTAVSADICIRAFP